MKNVAVEVKANHLYLGVDLNASQGNSKSGKSEIIAMTGGKHVEVQPGVFLTMTVYRKAAKPVKAAA